MIIPTRNPLNVFVNHEVVCLLNIDLCIYTKLLRRNKLGSIVHWSGPGENEAADNGPDDGDRA